MTNPSQATDVLWAWQNSAVRFTLSDWGALVVSGPDAASFLQGQTTQDIVALRVGEGAMAALLTQKGHVQFVVTVLCVAPQTYWLVLPQSALEALYSHLDKVHFTEKLTITAPDTPWRFETLQGLYAPLVCQTLGEQVKDALVLPWPEQNGLGRLVAMPVCAYSQYESFINTWQFQDASVRTMAKEDWDFWTVAAGFPQWPHDLPEPVILSETPLEPLAVHPAKGCYVGQEVINKIRTLGSPPRSMVGLCLSGHPTMPPSGTVLLRQGEPIGQLGRFADVPSQNETWAYVLIKRGVPLSQQPETFTWEDSACFTACLRSLPFVSAPDCVQTSHTFYELAIQCVTEHQESQAIALLQKALALNPLNTDATEVLGVLYAQTGQVQQAIELMTKLTQLDPGSVMAHTNLSRFYLMLGDKERAEAEKAQATVLQFQQAFQASGQKPPAQDTETARKIGMFQEVLAMDPVDPLANYSLGNLYLSQNDAKQALPYLEQAIQSNPRYSVAYLALGKTLERLDALDRANQIYQTGIAVAEHAGDLMPLREMESCRNALLVRRNQNNP